MYLKSENLFIIKIERSTVTATLYLPTKWCHVVQNRSTFLFLQCHCTVFFRKKYSFFFPFLLFGGATKPRMGKRNNGMHMGPTLEHVRGRSKELFWLFPLANVFDSGRKLIQSTKSRNFPSTKSSFCISHVLFY
jgi:hypothetical protein